MTTQLSWTASPSAACWQAAEHWAAGRMPAAATMHEALAVKFAAPADALGAFLRDENIPTTLFFEHLTPAACDIESNRALAHTALTKTVGRGRAEVLAERTAGLLTDCEAAYFAAFPKLREELELRYRPLRELWDARGPGLVAGVGRRTDRGLIPEAARVAAVPPYLGGGGWAAPASNTVVFAMVLANPIDQLPETLRLGWLVSLLNFDLPDFAEALPADRAREVAAWSMLPAVLEAAADVELVWPDTTGQLLATAAGAWLPTALRGGEVDVSGERLAAVTGWWTTARGNAAPWGVKLRALARLLVETA
ncbi:MAG: hypothetical protein C0483_20290 [Pirellula sp.]|nr:hypothetical protein [Pirellula sp.]